MTDTCPVCEALMDVPTSGVWAYCQACHRGKLRLVNDDGSPISTARQSPSALITRLGVDLAEYEAWVQERIPGARGAAAHTRALLRLWRRA